MRPLAADIIQIKATAPLSGISGVFEINSHETANSKKFPKQDPTGL